MQQLPADVRCVDSLPLFRKLDERDQLDGAADCTGVADDAVVVVDCSGAALQRTLKRDSLVDWRQLNETTPTQRRTGGAAAAAAAASAAVTATTPGPSSKRKLFDDVRPTAAAAPAKRRRFRLCDVYERLFDALPPQSHSAEADTLVLLRCVCGERERFVALVEAESRRFADVVALGK